MTNTKGLPIDFLVGRAVPPQLASPRPATIAANTTIRILIADDQTISRCGLRKLLETQSDFDIVGEASDPAEAVRSTHELKPDVLLVALSTHDWSGLDVLSQLYGSTETGTISVNLSTEIERSLDSVGKPIAEVEVQVYGENGQQAQVDEVGEIAVKSPAAIRSYEGSEEPARESFRDGYFFTGDLGRRDQDGLLYLVGRKKFLINKGGYKINPLEIEALLETHPKVEEAVVVGLPTSFGDEKVKAVVVLSGPCTEKDIIEHCRGRVADFKIPSLIEFREALPKTATGKIRRSFFAPSTQSQ